MNKALLVLPAILCGLDAHAAPAWPPTQCGREPAAPQIDESTVERYNASVDRVTLYGRQARAYDACVAKAASAAQAAISDEARRRMDAIQAVSLGLQRRIAGNFTALGAALRSRPPKGR